MHFLAPLSLLVIAALSATAASAQSASGPGMGAGPHASAPRSGNGFTPGWPMMTKEERATHQAAMAGMKSQGECTSYMDQHYRQMTKRARERGLPEPGGSRPDVCNGLPK